MAKITKAYRLPAKYIIHTAGPVWRGGNQKEAELLASCYRQSLLLAKKYNCISIAFPNISTGVYRFPKETAAETAIKTADNFLAQHEFPQKIIFVCFDSENFQLYQSKLL